MVNCNISSKQYKHQSGFTLIEILVATVILFSTLATVSLIYKGAYVASEKADSHINLSSITPFILGKVRRDIRAEGNNDIDELSGEGVSWGVSYHWQANLIDFKPPPDLFDIDTGEMKVNDNKYKLWHVSISFSFQNIKQNFTFKELSWNEK